HFLSSYLFKIIMFQVISEGTFGTNRAPQAGWRERENRGFMVPTREELDRAIASFPEAMLVCDPDGRIVGVNDPVCALTGYDRQDLLSKTLDDLADPSEARSARPLLP